MKLNEFLEKYVVGNNEDLKKKMKSVQYTFSNNIMALESKLGFDQQETADYLNISLEKLLRLESVDLSIDVSEYEAIVNKLLEEYWSHIQFSYSEPRISNDENQKKVNLKNNKEKELELKYNSKASEVVLNEH